MSEDFIQYKDLAENGEVIKSGFFDIISISGSFVTFKTKDGNLLTLPASRILKIKQKPNSILIREGSK